MLPIPSSVTVQMLTSTSQLIPSVDTNASSSVIAMNRAPSGSQQTATGASDDDRLPHCHVIPSVEYAERFDDPLPTPTPTNIDPLVAIANILPPPLSLPPTKPAV